MLCLDISKGDRISDMELRQVTPREHCQASKIPGISNMCANANCKRSKQGCFFLGAKEPADGQAPAVHVCACLCETFQMPLTFQKPILCIYPCIYLCHM